MMRSAQALIACLPPQAYDPSAAEVLAEATAAAAVLDDVIGLGDVLEREQDPALAALTLPDWERNYGLPDLCIGGASAPEPQRRANLLQRLVARGNLSRAQMLEIAEAMGYPGCGITEYGPMTCEGTCEDPVNGAECIGVWRLDVPVSTAITEATCESPCDAALRSWGNTALECVINRRKPAHTVALFGYAT